MASPRYQPGNKKRYACPACHRRFAAWTSLYQHSEMVHDTVPKMLECDLVLRSERRRLTAAGLPEAELPVVMPGRDTESDRMVAAT